MDPQVLLKNYPWMDLTMAECLIKADQDGYLQEMAESWPDLKRQNNNDVVKENGEG